MRIFRFLLCSVLVVFLCSAIIADPYHFTVTADQRSFDAAYDQLLAQMQTKIGGQGVFQVLPGDIDPPWNLRWRIDKRFGAPAVWFPGVGNHEEETAADMNYLRSDYTDGWNCRLPFKDYTNQNGPTGCVETTYTWDYGPAHFIMLNEYWNGGTTPGSDVATDGDVVPQLLAWLTADLASCNKPVIFVFGHEPAYPQNRHIGDSLDAHVENRDAFWNLLESDPRVVAYICGHTHYYSKYQNPGGRVWQIDVGDAGNDTDNNGKTFVDVTVSDSLVKMDVWRDPNVGTFSLSETINVPVAVWPTLAVTPSQAKTNADGVLIRLSGIVTASFPSYFYIGDASRTSGIRVRAPGHGLSSGISVTVAGELKTSPEDERYIDCPSIITDAPASVAAVGVRQRSIGGSDWNPLGLVTPGQYGIYDGKGLNNIGLLVRTAGKVSYSAGSFFYVDDGSGADDYSGYKGLKVVAPGLSIPTKDSFVTLNGVSSCCRLGYDHFGLLNACSGLPRRPYTAYNDCVWDTRQYIGAHVTTYGIGSGYIGATSGPLVDHATGDSTGMTATLFQGGGVVWQPDPVSGGSDCSAGTDAATTFGGTASMSGVTYYGSAAGWWVELELSGLDPARSYEFATSSNRNDPTYTDRITRYTLSGADSSSNSSTPGVVIGDAGAYSQFCTGYNTVNGYVARWTNIRSGTDGKIKIRAEAVPGAPQYKSYAFDVFQLSLLP